MTDNLPEPPSKKRLINKKNRSAWIISIVMIAFLVFQLIAGFFRPAKTNQSNADSPTTAVATVVFSEEDKAQSALQTFFNLLAEKRYVEAVTYYGGSFDDLAAAYPQDAADKPRLLQDACEQTPCLPIHSVVDVQPEGPNGFTFIVTFAGEDSRLFTQAAADGRQISKFPISVVKQNDHYLVQSLIPNES